MPTSKDIKSAMNQDFHDLIVMYYGTELWKNQ